MKACDILEKIGIKKVRDDNEPKELKEIKEKAIEVANILWYEIETVQKEISIQEHEIKETEIQIEILSQKRATLLSLYLLLAKELFIWREFRTKLEQYQRELRELREKYAHELKEFQVIVTKIENADFSKGLKGIDPKLVGLADSYIGEDEDLKELHLKLNKIDEGLTLIRRKEMKDSFEDSK